MLQNDDAAAQARERQPRGRSARRRTRAASRCTHFLWLIADGEGYEKLKDVAHKGLKGLKVAPFYGCQILRPSKLLGFDDPDRPSVARGDHRGVRRRGDRLPGEDQVLRVPDHPGPRGDGPRRADPADRAVDRGRRRRDGDAVPALPPLARRVAAEARDADRQELQMPILHLSQLIGVAAGLEDVGAQVQAPRRLGDARAREGRGAVADMRRTLGLAAAAARGRRGRMGALRVAAGSSGVARRRRCRDSRRRSTACGSSTSPTSISAPSRRTPRVWRARVAWAARRSPISSRSPAISSRAGAAAPRSRTAWRRLTPRLGTYAVLGNHDVDDSRDPFRRPDDLSDLRVPGTALLQDDELTVRVGDERVQVVGVDPGSYRRGTSRPAERADRDADLRILLCHYPDVVRRRPAGRLRARPRGPLPRRPDLRPVAVGPGAAQGSPRDVLGGPLRDRAGRAPRLARPRHELRPVPAARAARGDPPHAPQGRLRSVPYRLAPVTAASIRDAPPPCVECVFWQTREGRTTDKDRWAHRVEDDWGAWGTLYVARRGAAPRLRPVRARRTSSSGRGRCRPGRPRTTPSSSPARTSSTRRRRG